jgi:hypothetical protein
LQRLSNATSVDTVLPQRVQRITWVNPGMLGVRNSRGVGSGFGLGCFSRGSS